MTQALGRVQWAALIGGWARMSNLEPRKFGVGASPSAGKYITTEPDPVQIQFYRSCFPFREIATPPVPDIPQALGAFPPGA